MKDALSPQLRFGGLELDVRRGELHRGNQTILLQEQPFQILLILVERDGEIVTREEIQKKLWPDDTVVEFDQSINAAIKKLRKALGDSAEEPRYIRTVAKQGYRLIVPVERNGGNGIGPRVATSPASGQNEGTIAVRPRGRARRPWLLAGVVVVLVGLSAIIYSYLPSHRTPKLSQEDTVVLADFTNSTGDPLFDETLKQALTIQLQQSPFINLLSRRKAQQTLKLMNRSANEPLSGDVAREVCQRSGSKAMVIGSIRGSGPQYVIALTALDCNLGETLTEVQEQVVDKKSALKALDKAGKRLRANLGESLSSLEKYATPLEQATTPSLEALKAFSMARKVEYAEGWTAALPLYRRAVELDPDFAIALNDLAVLYTNLDENQRAEEYGRKAYQIRQKVSERERFAIEGNYYHHVTGELDKAAQIFELWHRNYPREVAPVGNLATVYCSLGDLQRCFEQAREAMRLEPNYGAVYVNLGATYENLNRLDEAEQVFKQAERRGVAAENLLQDWYQLAFLRDDTAQMARIVRASAGKPGIEDLILATQADTEAWHGKLQNARKLTKQATDSAESHDAKETAADYLAAAALREAAVENTKQARSDALLAVKVSQSRDIKALSAVALAQAGDRATAERLADEMDHAFPLDTLAQRYWLPTIRATIALENRNPISAIENLKNMGPIELGLTGLGANVFLCPAYLRGQAYLMLHDGKAAVPEFRKFIDYYGLLGNFPWGALARLGVARGYALQVQTDPAARDRALAAYENFLTLWKDADPDIPIYKQAKAEYAGLK